MTPFPEQLRAFMPASPGIEVEATRGSPEDYDDRNGYLPDFLAAGQRSGSRAQEGPCAPGYQTHRVLYTIPSIEPRP